MNLEKNVLSSESVVLDPFTAPKNRPGERSSAQGDFSAVVGMSNTHPTWTISKGRDVFIDYLKVRFYGAFNASDESDLLLLDPLFKILKINPQYYDVKDTRQWKNFYTFDDGTAIMSSNDLTETKTGACHYLELKGQGCRSFELRGGNWQQLLDYCVRFGNMVNRIDVSLDDFRGTLKITQLVDRVYKGLYSSSLRSWRTIDGGQVFTDEPSIIMSKNNGCTITFGTPKSKQLVIYNKAAERIARHHTVDVNDWVRYEARFFGETGVKVLKQVAVALKENTLNVVVPGLIAGLVDFKEFNNDLKIRRRDSWKPWLDLLGNNDEIKVTNKGVQESNLSSKQTWLSKASGRILAKAFLANPDEFYAYINYCVAQALDKFGHVDLSQVNDLRKLTKENIYSMDEAMELLENNFRRSYAPNAYLRKVIKHSDAFSNFDEEDEK